MSLFKTFSGSVALCACMCVGYLSAGPKKPVAQASAVPVNNQAVQLPFPTNPWTANAQDKTWHLRSLFVKQTPQGPAVVVLKNGSPLYDRFFFHPSLKTKAYIDENFLHSNGSEGFPDLPALEFATDFETDAKVQKCLSNALMLPQGNDAVILWLPIKVSATNQADQERLDQLTLQMPFEQFRNRMMRSIDLLIQNNGSEEDAMAVWAMENPTEDEEDQFCLEGWHIARMCRSIEPGDSIESIRDKRGWMPAVMSALEVRVRSALEPVADNGGAAAAE